MVTSRSECRARNYPECRFGGFSDVDGTVKFYQRVNAMLGPESVIVDVGCGRGKCVEDPVPLRRQLQIFKGKVQHVIGIDVDPAAATNPCLDEFRLLQDPRWPVPDAMADVVVSDWVLEHVENPEEFFAELARITKPGGVVCLRTPNAWGYVAMCSRMIPNKYHVDVLRRIRRGGQGDATRRDEDVFPTHYHCNTCGKVRRQLQQHGFEACVYTNDAEPSYLAFSPLLYRLGTWYQAICPGFLRSAIFAFGRKT